MGRKPPLGDYSSQGLFRNGLLSPRRLYTHKTGHSKAFCRNPLIVRFSYIIDSNGVEGFFENKFGRVCITDSCTCGIFGPALDESRIVSLSLLGGRPKPLIHYGVCRALWGNFDCKLELKVNVILGDAGVIGTSYGLFLSFLLWWHVSYNKKCILRP